MHYYGTKLFIAKSSDSASDLELPFRTQCGSPEWENGRCRIFRADARYTGKSYFRAYAEELLDEVFDMVHENVPIDFVNGALRYRLGNRIPALSFAYGWGCR